MHTISAILSTLAGALVSALGLGVGLKGPDCRVVGIVPGEAFDNWACD